VLQRFGKSLFHLKNPIAAEGPNMKVESVSAFPIRVRMKDKLVAGAMVYDDYMSVLVRVECDGEVGWGEAMTRFSPLATSEMVGWIAGRVTGETFEGPREAWSAVWDLYRVRGQTRGIAVEALSGVETALWDAMGKLRREPVGRMLGKQRSAELPVYAGSVFGSRGPMGTQVQRVRDAGLRGFKLKIGFGVEKDVRLARQARRMWDDCMLVLDANGAYDARRANALISRVVDFQPEWLEEPLPSDDFEGYDLLEREVPLASGEAWYAGDFARVFSHRSVDVLEPSVSRCGGVLTDFMVAARAEKEGLGFAPMLGVNSGVSLAASLHVASASACLAVEYDVFDNPLLTELVTGLPLPKGGKIKVPTSPGLGIEVDEGFLRSHAVKR